MFLLRLLGVFGITDPHLLSEDEREQAKQAKEQTLRLLSDALKKKENLLVEDPKEFGDQKMRDKCCRLITTDLVKDLIRELEKVTFTKNTNPEMDTGVNAYVYPGSEDRTIYLCALFWKKDPGSRSRQGTIIHEVSHFLGYGHTVKKNKERVKKSPQSMLCPLDCYKISLAFTYSMDHPGTYRDGAYSCCGETSRDTVCEESKMAKKLRSSRAKKNVTVQQRDPVMKTKNDLLKAQDDLEKAMIDAAKTLVDLEATWADLKRAKANLRKAHDNFKETLINLVTD